MSDKWYEAFRVFWSSNIHGWGVEERGAEYFLAMQAFRHGHDCGRAESKAEDAAMETEATP